LLRASPGLPKVCVYNEVLAPTLGGEKFLKPFRAAVRGELDAPFVLVIEGSIPNEKINGDGAYPGAAIGNVFLGGDGFGVALADRVPPL